MASTRSTRPSRKVTKKASTTTKKKTSRKTSTRKTSKRATKNATTPKPKPQKVKKDDTAVVIEDCEDNLEMLFKHVSKELLVELLLCNNVEVKSSTKKAKVVEKLMQTTAARGEEVLLESLKKATMREFINELKKSAAASPNNKQELRKELKELMGDTDQLSASLNKLKADTLDAISSDLGFKEEGNKKDKIEGLIDECRLLGAKSLFDHVLYSYMKELCGKLGLSAKGQKEHLVARFLGQAYRFLLDDAKVPPKRAKGEKKEKKKKEPAPRPDEKLIKEGIDSLELHQYYADQLKNYIETHSLKKGHNKKEMVKIILAHLKGDESVLQKNQPSVGNKRKRKSGSDGKASKKQKTA